ncbi:MAG: transglutaminase-like domain-containing protein [Zoogloeaceae bacterium]|nr:transglutaminase-like domain-containing protein [Zoogloeaceae bacterium]
MKRRVFLASALSLLAIPTAEAAKKKKSEEKNGKKSSAKNKSKNKGKSASRPAAAPANADIFNPHDGTSASRLPPVKPAQLPENWRRFAVTFALEAPASSAPLRLSFPLPLHQTTPVHPWQRLQQTSWQGNGAQFALAREADREKDILRCDWPSGSAPRFSLQVELSLADRRLDVSRRTFAPEREDILRANLAATDWLPVEDEARQLARTILGRIIDPVARARALYDWVVRECAYESGKPYGDSDIRQQIARRQYGGGDADINGLYITLLRAAGLPARCLAGLRLAPSRLAPSLGIADDTATDIAAAAHCRVEFYVPGYNWIPADPADACRAIALDTLSEDDARALQRLLFGFWEMNWLALHHTENPALPPLVASREGEETPVDYICRLQGREEES